MFFYLRLRSCLFIQFQTPFPTMPPKNGNQKGKTPRDPAKTKGKPASALNPQKRETSSPSASPPISPSKVTKSKPKKMKTNGREAKKQALDGKVGRPTHHCYKCKAAVKPSCIRKDHVAQCEIYGNYHSNISECRECQREREREREEERKKRDKERDDRANKRGH
jgi:hypothetical protein